ncbi:unnamed protein product, partial [marine sediment metagenome]
YANLASKVSVEEIQNMFLTLAAEEAKHKLRLESIYDDEILREN